MRYEVINPREVGSKPTTNQPHVRYSSQAPSGIRNARNHRASPDVSPAITQDARGTLYLAGESGALFRSDDLGKTWRALASPYAGSFFGALTTADGALLIFGLRGNLYRSSDRGQTWVRIETGTKASLMSGLQSAAGRVVLVGLSGTILVSDDDGRSFGTTNRADRRALTGVIEVPSGALLLLGEGGFAESILPRNQAYTKDR